VRRVCALASGRELAWAGRTTVVDTLFNSDPLGEIRIEVPDAIVDDCATVLVLEVDGAT
jgi:alpha-L-fucosidase